MVLTSLSGWLKTALGKSGVSRRDRGQRFRPRLEALEDRTVPSTLTVTNNHDHGAGSLRDTIAAASSGDTIVFDHSLNHETITLTTGDLAIAKNLDIDGPGADTLTVSGGGASRVFDISGAVTVGISGLTIANGKEVVTVEGDGGGGILNEAGATLVLSQTVLTNNQAVALVSGFDVLGGGLLNKGTVTIQNSTFKGNASLGGGGSGTFAGGSAGGAVDNEGGTLTVTDSAFNNNEVYSVAPAAGMFNFATGGAIMSETGVLNSNPALATIRNSSFTSNLATGGDSVTGEAGGICVQSAIAGQPGLATMTIDNCTLTGNQAIGGPNGNGNAYSGGLGGGILNSGVLTVDNSTLTGNQAIGGSGSVPSVGGFANPATGAGQGGGINNDTGTLTVNNCTLTGNQAIGANTAAGPGGIATGGGIDCWGIGLGFDNSSLIVNNSTLSGNQAIAGTGGPGSSAPQLGFAAGGGIDIAFDSPATVSNSTLVGNTATGSTAGAGVNGGTAVGAGICLGFSTLFSTTAQPIVDTSTLQLSNSTLDCNVALGGQGGAGALGGTALGGGLGINTGCSATVTNSTFKNNVANGSQTSVGQANGGGGIDNAGTLVLSNSKLKDNRAITTIGSDVLGGGLLNNQGSATITATTFDGNQALGGGSFSFFGGSTGGAIDSYEGATLDVAGSQFNDNQAISAADATGDFFYATGGAIEEDAGIINNNPSTAVITNSSFTDNLVTGGFGVLGNGGGIDIQSANNTTAGLVTMTLVGCSVTGNRSVGGGGGNGLTTGDSEGVGGGIESVKGTCDITDCTIANNQAVGGDGATISAADPYAGSGFGGGISNNDSGIVPGTGGIGIPTEIGAMIISNSTIAGNVVRGGNTTAGPGGYAVGGGISNSPLGNLTMTNSAVVGNQALGGTGSAPSAGGVLGGFAFGGGVDTSNVGSHATIIDCVIAGNSAVGGAGSPGNVGGNGYGGGLGVGWGTLIGSGTDGSSLTLIDSVVDNNQALGGRGGAGANGGDGLGGGLFIGLTASATITASQIENNQADGGEEGKGGSDGNGIGGGVYNLGTFAFDALTVIKKNQASTSNDNIGP